jgi:hypothetical protein
MLQRVIVSVTIVLYSMCLRSLKLDGLQLLGRVIAAWREMIVKVLVVIAVLEMLKFQVRVKLVLVSVR